MADPHRMLACGWVISLHLFANVLSFTVSPSPVARAGSSIPSYVSSSGRPMSRLSSSASNSTTTATASDAMNLTGEWNDWPTLSSLTANKDNNVLDYALLPQDVSAIEAYWDSVMPKVSYLGTDAAAKIYRALTVAYRAHRGQRRKSGEPFIIHPVSVALLLAGLKMDAETVMAGLLHDTVEDTELTFEQIDACFGPTVRSIVEGETKVSKLPCLLSSSSGNTTAIANSTATTADETQAENLRQMFVAMTDDYRIIIVKLADRLHNMRTLQHMKPHKIRRISRETLDIFAPLAHRMGIWQVKSELEDIAFKWLYPQAHKKLNRLLRQHQTKYRETLDKTQHVLQRVLEDDLTLTQQAAKVEVVGRTKEMYSLWHKMETKGVESLDRIVDVVAIRVILTPMQEEEDDYDEDENDADRGVWLCYHVLGLVQHLPGYTPVPTRVKDYISFPKPNGYQSLHTALILNGRTIEVQIRTSAMHRVAEYGMASHWAYTDGKRRRVHNAPDLYTTPWLSSIKDWNNDRISARDFVDSVRRELLGKRVFVFLRNGKILNLARGATAIDAAFQIHTEVGLNMHGVEINGKPVPLSYQLENGDVVSILTGNGRPQTDWMRHAKSRSTRSKLRAYFRAREKESLREAGNAILMSYLSLHGDRICAESHLDFDFAIPTTEEGLARFLPGQSRYESVDDLLVAIGSLTKRTRLHKIVSQLFAVPVGTLLDAERSHGIAANEDIRDDADSLLPHGYQEGGQIEHLLAGLDLSVEDADPELVCCDCLPVFGDQVVGTRQNRDSPTTVHRLGCAHAQRAINFAQAQLRSGRNRHEPSKSVQVDSVSLRRQNGYFWRPNISTENHSDGQASDSIEQEPVKLLWVDPTGTDIMFLTEIVVHCEDRKLLLADCSEVVSEMVEIVRTGSLTTKEHATLIFLVEVQGLCQLQQLMDRLSDVKSVMAVERKFGTELL